MKKSTSPNAGWRPGEKVNSPVDTFVSLDPSDNPPHENYKFLIGSVVPRPIAFVSTMSAAGVGNLAPFSFFMGVASNPLSLAISVATGKGGGKKDTLKNIEETGEFVVNSANEWLVEAVCHCAGAYPNGVDEMLMVGLTPLPSIKVKPHRVSESATQMECVVEQLVQVGDGSPGSAVLVVGRVVQCHAWEKAVNNGRIDIEQIRPAARLGGFGYSNIGEYYELQIPTEDQLLPKR